MRSRDPLVNKRVHWGCLWTFCVIGWIIAIVYLVADLLGTGLDLF